MKKFFVFSIIAVVFCAMAVIFTHKDVDMINIK